MADIVTRLRRAVDNEPFMLGGEHDLLKAALAEVERLRAEIERMRTVYVLLVSEEAGPVDSATCWYEDKIVGCYISREAAEGAAKLLMADWRINEYALKGKP